MKGIVITLLTFFVGTLLPIIVAEYRMVCYFSSWAVYRPGPGKFDVEQIDPTLCTHLIYAFVSLSGNDILILDPWNELEDNEEKGALKRFVKLKEKNPKVKTMIAIGGWNKGSQIFSSMASTDAGRKAFAKNAANFVKRYGFDGLDVDWEYPNQRGGNQKDVQNFGWLLKELREEFDKNGLILSVAVVASEFLMSVSYNVPTVSQYVDFINLMTYDLHGPWDQVTGNNAPLYMSTVHDYTDFQKQLNVYACIDIWLRKGADPKKINLGMPFYGHTYTLNDANNVGLGSPSYNPGTPGPYTGEAGMLGYNEIVELQTKGDWTIAWEEQQMVPYMYQGNQWVSYDDPKSLALKVTLAKKMGLGGGMVWNIETDDFNGVSGTKNPLLRAINEAFGNINPRDFPGQGSTVIPQSITTNTPTTAAYSNDPTTLCKIPNSYVRDPNDCAKFYFCQLLNGNYITYPFTCAPGTLFDPRYNTCNYPWLVNCST